MNSSLIEPPRFVHQTDLFRPHNDPDDHWDLACAYALAIQNMAVLAGILIDYPPGAPILNGESDPDLGAVGQMSYLTGVNPRVAVGSPELFSTRRPCEGQTPSGVKMLLTQMRESPDGLFVTSVGGARDLADALVREPDLFAEKCRGIYLNAGSGSSDPAAVKALEWNVKLDPLGFAEIFKAPCPVFWMPCLEDEAGAGDPGSREYATHFLFRQEEILAELPPSLRNYFGWMFSKETTSAWLEALIKDFEPLLAVKSTEDRMMYSTGAFFDLAGYGVTREGRILPKADLSADWVYRFEPVQVECTPGGITRWYPCDSPCSNRFLFHVLDREKYPAAMTAAMRELLLGAFSGMQTVYPYRVDQRKIPRSKLAASNP